VTAALFVAQYVSALCGGVGFGINVNQTTAAHSAYQCIGIS